MTTLYQNGKIYIERDTFAQCMLVQGNTVAAVGTPQQLQQYIENSDIDKNGITTVDLEGKTVIPGINDSHQHTYGVGKLLASVNLMNTASIDEMVAKGRAFLEQTPVAAGGVLVGRGWNQDYFTGEKRMPTRHDLDRISDQIPIIFTRACGHILVANTKALQLAGIDKNTKAAPGGEIYREADGTPNGLVSENAIPQISVIIPQITPQSVARSLSLAMERAAQYGITTLQTNDIDGEHWRTVQQGYELLYKTNPKAIRTYQQSTFTDPEEYKSFISAGCKTGDGDDMFRYGPLKMFSDGSLGARTAFMRRPYADDKSTCGIPTLTPQQLETMVRIASENSCQVAVHCIGDGAMEMVLDAYDKVIGDKNHLRHGIVHCQITDRELIQRFKQKDILAYVQPVFIHYDMTVVESRVGSDLAATSYAFGDMYRMGIHTAYGTDSPVEDMNPWENIYCAVTRARLDGSRQYLPQQAVDVFDAVDQYTEGSAYAEFAENKKGRLKAGFLADFTVLDRDVFTIPAEEIKNIKAVKTVVDGRVIFEI